MEKNVREILEGTENFVKDLLAECLKSGSISKVDPTMAVYAAKFLNGYLGAKERLIEEAQQADINRKEMRDKLNKMESELGTIKNMLASQNDMLKSIQRATKDKQ